MLSRLLESFIPAAAAAPLPQQQQQQQQQLQQLQQQEQQQQLQQELQQTRTISFDCVDFRLLLSTSAAKGCVTFGGADTLTRAQQKLCSH